MVLKLFSYKLQMYPEIRGKDEIKKIDLFLLS